MKRLLSVCLVFLLCGSAAIAHPHVFVDSKIAVRFDAGILLGITFTWTFDELFSSMILTDYDRKHTGTFTPAQVKAIKEGAFDNLENYHYFVALQVGKKKLPRFLIESFTPSVTGEGKLVYSFFVPLKLAVTAAEQTVSVTVYDDSYYVAFTVLKPGDVDIQSDGQVACSLAIEKTAVKPEWPGQYMPDQLAIRFKEK